MSPGVQKKRKRRHHHPKSQTLSAVRNEINVVPLVDIVLVLLIIFMVVTPEMARGKDIPLPATRHHESESDKQQPVVVLDRGGQLYFDQEKIESMDALKQRVEEAWDSGKEVPRRVYVKADAELPYKEVYPLIMAMHDLGVPGVDLGTNELREAK